jgi:ParB family chromosome partitioning protein
VRPSSTGEAAYEIIAGERRFRASKIAGLTEVPVIIKDFDDKATLEVALIENLQREDLNPLEEAESYKRLLEEFKYTQEELSKVIGKSRSYLSNMMRLLELPDEIKQMVEQKELTVGHARALLSAQDPVALATEVLKKGYSVRKTERLASKKGSGLIKSRPAIEKPDDIIVLENELSNVLAAKLSIKWNGHSGDIQIKCDTLDKLDAVLQRLSIGGPIE